MKSTPVWERVDHAHIIDQSEVEVDEIKGKFIYFSDHQSPECYRTLIIYIQGG